jgi:hypothetical protein
VRGGATFTLLIFILLLISSGLMYYYFHRCQVLEIEVAKWKSGVKEREPETAVVATPKAEKKESLRDMAASFGAKLAGTPAAVPARIATPTPTPAATPAPGAEAPRKSQTPEPTGTEDSNNKALPTEGDLPAPEQTPVSTPRTTPKPTAGAKPTAAPRARNTPIGSIYDLQNTAATPVDGDEPAVRVRAPKRTPSAKLNLNER